MRRTTCVSLLSCLLLLAGSPAPATNEAIGVRARSIMREVLQSEPARGTRPGIMIVRGRDRLAARNAGDTFIPASLMKLATTSAALITFGPEHRFTTRALVTKAKPDGSVGHLVLLGGGDPTLATGAYRAKWLTRRDGMTQDERVFPSGSPTIQELARAIVKAGVTRVRGTVIADDSLFDQKRTQDGWKSSYLDRSTGGPHVGLISALIVNQGYTSTSRTTIATSPALFAARKLRAELRDRGIAVEGKAAYGTTPADATEVASVQSPPLDEIVGWVNRWSVNHPPELLLKGLGAAFGGAGTTAAGRRVVKATLNEAGVDIARLAMKDGSGLSLQNRITPRTLAGILRWGLRSQGDDALAFRRSIAVACRPGTLLYRMCKSKARNNLRGKTGLVTDVRGMAGWVRGADGRLTIYVAIFNRARDESALTSTLNLLGRRLAHLQ